MTTIWWVRHGPTHAKSMVGWSDIPADLSDTRALARLEAALPRHAPILSSDLIRTRETADALQGARMRLQDMPALREINFGAWELRSFAEVEAETPDLIRAYWEHPGDVRPPGGESWHEVCARVDGAVDALVQQHEGDLIIVAHFGVIVTQIQRALRIGAYEAFGHRIENLSLTRLRFDGQWSADLINHIV